MLGAVFGITAVMHVPFGLGLAWTLTRFGVPASGLVSLGVTAALVIALRFLVRHAIDDKPTSRLGSIPVEAYYVHWCACPVAVIAFVLIALGEVAYAIARGGPVDLGMAGAVAYGIGLVPAAWGVLVRRRWVRLKTLDVPIENLPSAFEGYRIVQLSDLHIGSLAPRSRGERWVRRVNELDADLVALTGDYVTNGVAFHADIAKILCSLRARDGAVAVMGNHDYFGDGEPLITLLREGGVDVLRNERKSVERDGESLVIAGVDDTWTRRADCAKTMNGADPSSAIVALAHDPQLFPELAALGASLVLSGHTHWGQVAIPFVPTRYNLSRLSYRYHAGIYRHNGAMLYIHPGLGTTGPPVRIGAAPEITILRLRRLAV